MKLIVNGEEFEHTGAETVISLLVGYGVNAERVAVMLNEDIVSRELWNTVNLSEGDRIEILTFAGGGGGNGRAE